MFWSTIRSGGVGVGSVFVFIIYSNNSILIPWFHLYFSGLATTLTGRVAFSAQLTHTITNLGSGQAIIFDQKITDFGNNYDNSDGIFTVPVSGYYVFTWTFGVVGDNDLATALVVHGRKISNSVNNGAENDGGQVSNTVVVQANKNDHVMIQTSMVSQGYDYKTIGEQGANTFSGWLLFETS